MKRKYDAFPLKEKTQGFPRGTPYRLLYRSFPHWDGVPLHYHDSLELNLYHGIRGKVFLNGFEYDLESHSLIILPPGTLHSYDIPGQQGQMIVLQISLTDLGRFLNVDETIRALGFTWSGLPFFSERSEVPRLCYKLIEAAGLDMDDLVTADFLIWIIELFRALALLDEREKPGRGNRENPDWLRRTIDYTEASFHRKLPLGETADAAGFSPAYFSRLFKKSTGINYKDYLQSVRLERGEELLREGVCVSEAAELAGFQDMSYFIKVFREARGVSPGRYRQSLE